MIRSDKKEGFFIKSSLGIGADIQKDLFIKPGALLVDCLRNSEGLIVKSELLQFERSQKVDDCFSLLLAVAAEVIIPLKIGDRLIGFISLSEKTSNDIYSQEDINALTFFAVEAAKALEHSRVYAEAIVDRATKTFNKNYFLMRLREEIARSKRYQRPISLLFVQLNDLKDELLLKAAGLLLKTKIRNVDVLGRYSDSVFAIILPETAAGQNDSPQALEKHKEDTMLVANRISQGIDGFVSSHEGKEVKLSANIGVCCFDSQDKQFTEDDFIKDTAAALVKARQSESTKIFCSERKK